MRAQKNVYLDLLRNVAGGIILGMFRILRLNNEQLVSMKELLLNSISVKCLQFIEFISNKYSNQDVSLILKYNEVSSIWILQFTKEVQYQNFEKC